MSISCPKCGIEHARNGQRLCADCHAAYMREWRKTHPLNDGHRKRDGARSVASVYLRRGVLQHRPCEVCGDPDSQMHHPDHELPLQVVWLCRPHHLAWHAHWRNVSRVTFERWLGEASEARMAAE